MRVLAADIGGTNARFAIFRGKRIVKRKTLASKDYDSLLEATREFLGRSKVDAACFGIPCAVEERCKVTNLPWVIDRKKLEKGLGVPVKLINDFEAVCHGISLLLPKDFRTLRRGSPKLKPKVVVGAGTGLGQAFLVWQDEWVVLPSEGGHADFAPQTHEQVGLLGFLKTKHRKESHGHVSMERVLSGPGIESIHTFLTGEHKKSEEIKAGSTLALFSRIYGQHAGNLALTMIAGEVILAGGIAPDVIPKFKKEFLEGMDFKGRQSGISKVPVRIVVNKDVGLVGAASQAQ